MTPAPTPVQVTLYPGETATLTVSAVAQPPLVPLFGVDAPVGTQWAAAIKEFPGLAYTRNFGKDGDDPDALPELIPGETTGKWPLLPPGAIVHESWRDEETALRPYLDALRHPVYLTWFHEPVRKVSPAEHRAKGEYVTDTVAAHPNGHLVLGHGPILTRWNLDEGEVDPREWGYRGMTHFGVDCYSQDRTAYWPAERMFACLNKVEDAFPGVRLLVPELGIVQTATDISDEGRAATLREYAHYLRRRGDVDAVAYFHSDAFPQYKLSGRSAEAWRWVLAHQ